jgi:hypothetical protein
MVYPLKATGIVDEDRLKKLMDIVTKKEEIS